MDIEGIAVERVKREIYKYNCLKEFLNSNDKMPLWDGEIFIYDENSEYNSNSKFLGKISVQVKGHKVAKIKSGNSKYTVDVENLIAYQKTGKGTLLFVVEIIDSETTQIYYANLLPVDLKEILSKVKDDQKKVNVDIKPIKEKSSSSMKMICQNFLNNSNEQMNIEIKNIDEIKDIKEINFSVWGDKEYIENYMFNNDIYTYAICEKDNKKIALPKLKDIQTFKTVSTEVSIKNKKYYNEITFIKNRNEEYALIGESIKFYISDNKINFNISGNIYERIIDIKFILDLLENKEITISDRTFNLNGYKNKQDYITKLNNNLILLQSIKDIFDKYNIRFEKDISKLNSEERKNLVRFIKINKGELIKDLDAVTPYYIDVVEYRIAFIILKESENEIEILNYFDSNIMDKVKVFFIDQNNEQVFISPYINLTTQNLLEFSNIDIDIIEKSFETEYYTEEICERYNMFLLELIKAYDVSKDKKWIKFAEKLVDKILLYSNLPVYIINKFQIIKRIRNLTLEEKEELYKIKEKESDNIIQCGIAILLDNRSDFERYFNKIGIKQKEFKKFPIYNLIK